MKSALHVVTDMDRHLRLVQIKNEETEEEKAAELANKNKDFVQFMREAMDRFISLISQSPTAAQALIFMARTMSRQNAMSASMDVLCEACGAGRSSMSRAVKILEQEGWLKVDRTGSKNTYYLNSRAFWATGRSFKNSPDVFSSLILTPKSTTGGGKGNGFKVRSVPVVTKKQSRSGFKK